MNNNKQKCGKSYATEQKANDFSNDLRMKYPNQELQIAYKCNKCSHWHLCPESRHTPSKQCAHCRDSKGNPKQLYQDRDSAEKRMEILKKEHQKILSIYECPHNPYQYHLSHKKYVYINNQRHAV